MDFINSIHCSSRVHCNACLTAPKWRLSSGAPDICPHGVTLENATAQPIQPEPWPLLAQPLKYMAHPGDRGLGDIVARVIGPIGGDLYKAWFKKVFNRSCGCTERQDQLNLRYPL